MFIKKEISELNRLNVEEFKSIEKIPLVVVLDNIRSQHNVGAVFRTCDAFLVEKIYLCGITATPPNREIHKAALGATESVDWEYFEKTTDVINSLKHHGFSIFALEQTQNSISFFEFGTDYKSAPATPTALILGNEVDGISDDVMALVDGALEIPQFGTKHSLNVSVSAGIAIWEIFKLLSK
ncbi:MAG: RNA methyltransferase [Bacteroidales bacterium]|jgi:tRNA G18 (ribose-2'-O)-methylase SpoU|nr:RNA methyltransferase [Bacteroidales bacterium]